MNRIEKKFKELRTKKKKALIVFITAGFPSLKKTGELVLAFERDGADLIELGVPFSDPLADGPVIQESSKKSLERKTTLSKILRTVASLRKRTQIPLILMSYLNPVLNYGLKAFGKEASKAGVDGVIVPDLPPEEGREISKILRQSGIDLVYLLAPTTAGARVGRVTGASRGFIYYVSMTGVTGMNGAVSDKLYKNVRLAKTKTSLPVCVGFGISTPERAKAVAAFSDGVIVGSAIVKPLLRYPAMNASPFSKKFLKPFSRALQGGA